MVIILKTSSILNIVSKFLFPIILLFGGYIIFYGDTSPGGGFQGGAIIATAFILIAFIDNEKKLNLSFLLKLEKIFFLLLLLISSLSLFTRGEIFTNFVSDKYDPILKRIFLVSLNSIIGIKVAAGLTAIFSIFIKEGKQ